jgi:hypothetical protein
MCRSVQSVADADIEQGQGAQTAGQKDGGGWQRAQNVARYAAITITNAVGHFGIEREERGLGRGLIKSTFSVQRCNPSGALKRRKEDGPGPDDQGHKQGEVVYAKEYPADSCGFL